MLRKKSRFYEKIKEESCLLAEKKIRRHRRDEVEIVNNSDLVKIPDFVACFHKGLPHDRSGLVEKEEFYKLLDFCHGKSSKLDKIQLGGQEKLVNPSCIYTLSPDNRAKETFWLPVTPSLKSKIAGAELLELYAMSLVRDLPFREWNTSALLKWLAQELSRLEEFAGPKDQGQVTIKTIFRGESSGDLVGPYLSQFLYYTIHEGAQKYEQRILVYPQDSDQVTSYQACLDLQNGKSVPALEPRPIPRYIHTLRDGASYVHNDYPGQAAYNAVKILLDLGVPFNCHPETNERYFVDLETTDLFKLIGTAVKLALATAWHHKWSQLRLRPEAMAMLVDLARNKGKNPYHLDEQLLKSPILDKIEAKWHSYCLPQVYPEGSPCHPSYPSGHSTWIGAAVTIIKAFFDNEYEIPALETNYDGSQLLPLGYKVKVGHELDKLASNIATFRNAAGIHYRGDMLGIYLGEAIALELLKETVQCYAFPVKFKLKTRAGEWLVISNCQCG